MIFMVVTQPQNLIGREASGIDVEASYRFPMSSLVGALSGDMVIRAMASRVLKLDTEDTDGNVYDGAGVVGSWGGSIPPFPGPDARGAARLPVDQVQGRYGLS